MIVYSQQRKMNEMQIYGFLLLKHFKNSFWLSRNNTEFFDSHFRN